MNYKSRFIRTESPIRAEFEGLNMNTNLALMNYTNNK